MAMARGATVIGTTSTPEKAELAKAHGVDHVILYKKENTVKRVLELTDGIGANVIYDGVGKTTYVICVNSSVTILCAAGSMTTSR
jgi:NADPH2:quinone reductase